MMLRREVVQIFEKLQGDMPQFIQFTLSKHYKFLVPVQTLLVIK